MIVDVVAYVTTAVMSGSVSKRCLGKQQFIMRNEWHGNPLDFLCFLSSFCLLNSLHSFIVIAIFFYFFANERV